ncbi:hypothetical protein B0H19DRAFT_868485, partial [Mycena capillaripes]
PLSQARLQGKQICKPEVVKYSDVLFAEATIKWMVVTDQARIFQSLRDPRLLTSQPLRTVDNAHFQEMIDIASRAQDGVQGPQRRAILAGMISMFKKKQLQLREHLNV